MPKHDYRGDVSPSGLTNGRQQAVSTYLQHERDQRQELQT